MKEKQDKIVVTCALPYANGPLHVGHIRSTYLPADIYARYFRMLGKDIAFICGSDEHGTPITVTAEREKKTPAEIAKKYHNIMGRELEALGINFEIFSRTSNPQNIKYAQEFFTTAFEKNYIYEKEVDQYYCEKCKRFLPDRYVEGSCPKCGEEGARGDHCEKCAQVLDTLSNPHCLICKSTPNLAKTKHWFFKLTDFKKELEKFLNQKQIPGNVKNYALSWLPKLQDWCITRDLEWGVPVPLKEAKNKVFYVWWDAPIGYISATQEWGSALGKDGTEYWKHGKIIHFIGKDIIYHHALFWPAMLLAHGKYKLPWAVVAGEYLSLEGKKMSTSRNWVVWVSDFLKKYPADYMRYYLTITTPLNADMDFSWKEFKTRINNELSNILGNFVNRVLIFVQKNYEGKIPKPGKYGKEENAAFEKMQKTSERAGKKIESFDFLGALKEVMELAKFGNQYLNEKAPWKEKNDTAVYVSANIVKALAVLLSPFLPETAQKIWEQLGFEGKVEKEKWSSATELIKEGQGIGEIKVLVEKVEI